MKDQYSAALLKDGLLDKGDAALRRAIKRLNHQAKKRDHKDKERNWKR